MLTPRFTTPLLAATLLALGACGGDDAPSTAALDDDDGILAFVPADTPYVFASIAPLPDAVLDMMEASSDSMFAAYETVLRESLGEIQADLENDGTDPESARTALSLLTAMAGLMQSDELRAAGVPRSPQAAVYGVGLLPVVRMELDDADAFNAKISEIAKEAEVELETAEVGGASYRYAGDDELRIAIAVIDDYAVATLVPAQLPESALAAVLGVEQPAESIADSGALTTLAETYEFTPYGLGYIDIRGVASAFVDPASEVDTALFALADEPMEISNVCKAEVLEMAGVAPRFVSGYTGVTRGQLSSNTILELRSDLASELAALTTVVPGLGPDHGGLGSFGMGLDLLGAKNFYEARLDAMEEDPYECEYFAEMMAGVAAARQTVNQPMPPIVYGFKGFVAVVDDVTGMDIAAQQPPTDVKARVLLANDNAPGLLAMGTMMSPELAALDIQPDGSAVAFTLPPMAGGFEQAFIGMTDAAIGLGVGEGSDEGLESLLASDGGTPAPFMTMHLDGARYYEMISEAVKASAEEPNEDGSPKNYSPEMQEAVSQVMSGVSDLIERVSVNVNLTERGVEMPSTVTMKE